MPLWPFIFLQTDPAANLTFNLRLSDSEREAKEKLALPFMFSKEKYKRFHVSDFSHGFFYKEPTKTALFVLQEDSPALLRPRFRTNCVRAGC